MIDLHRLAVFRSVVAAGSVVGAAQALGYSPSAVSQQVSALQRETGLVLVERDGRGLRPTTVGLQFAAEAQRVLERAAGLDVVAADLRSGRSGRLTISYISSAGQAWIPRVVPLLAREYPDLVLDLRLSELGDPRDPLPDLEIGVDSGVGRLGERAGVVVETLLEEPFVVVVPRGHPFASRGAVTLTEAGREPWIDNDVLRGRCREILLTACEAAGLTPTFRVQTFDYPSALSFVAAGLGISVMPRLGTATLPPEVQVVAIEPPAPRRSVVLRVHPEAARNRAARRARELLAAAAADTDRGYAKAGTEPASRATQ